MTELKQARRMQAEIGENPTDGSMAAHSTQDTDAPLALLYGEPLRQCPQGLYIPPDALRVFLERFEGPLDLLLYLIRSQKFDVMDIPMAIVTDQYMTYVELIRQSNLGLASAYLVMAATLMSIKSRLLLPVSKEDGEEDEVEDPRAELMRRLLEYEKIKHSAKLLDQLPRLGRDFWLVEGTDGAQPEASKPEPDAQELAGAWLDVLARMKLSMRHRVMRQSLSVREHMTTILRRLSMSPWVTLDQLLAAEKSEAASEREAVAVWCLALLELAKDDLIRLTQAAPYAPIYATPVGLKLQAEHVDTAAHQWVSLKADRLTEVALEEDEMEESQTGEMPLEDAYGQQRLF